MTQLIVEGSKNGFQFGPDEIEIPEQRLTERTADAVLDALLQTDDPCQDSIEALKPERQRQAREQDASARDRAVQHGFTALRYRVPGQAVQVVL